MALAGMHVARSLSSAPPLAQALVHMCEPASHLEMQLRFSAILSRALRDARSWIDSERVEIGERLLAHATSPNCHNVNYFDALLHVHGRFALRHSLP